MNGFAGDSLASALLAIRVGGRSFKFIVRAGCLPLIHRIFEFGNRTVVLR